ncbi:MAG: trimethylamine methyltransferase family protein, partial [Acidobacteria bacterium]|nr:trimethylamine methyltransferase family protein [Acidobacteriota bacterium]
QREDPIATSLFAGLGDEMDFLRTEHTRKWFKQEHTYPLLIDRDTYDTWDSLGAKNIETRAAERVQEILGTVHRPDISLVKALRDIMTADAEASGITGLLFTE